MARKKSTKKNSVEFGFLVAFKLPGALHARLDATLAQERAERTMMAISMSDVVRTLLVEALDARDAAAPRLHQSETLERDSSA